MKRIVFLTLSLLLIVTSAFSLEPMKVAFVNTSGNTFSVQVKLAANGTDLFAGETFNSMMANGSGVVIINVQDYAGSSNQWANFAPEDVTTNHTLDIYVNETIYSQVRLDQLLLTQAQTSVFDNNGDLNPPTSGSSLGTDDNRWEDAYISQNTLHVGPDGGMTGSTEMTLSYNSGEGQFGIDGTNAMTISATGVTLPGAFTLQNLGGSGNRNIGVDNDGNVVVNSNPNITAGDGLTIDGSNVLDVGGSSTIIANADDIAVNSSATANQVLLSSGTVGTAATYGAVPLGNSSSVSGTLPVTNGGTGVTTLATGNFLQGNGTGAVTATKAVPTGDVVGTSDVQTLTNKTIDVNSNTITNIFPDQTGNSGNFLTTNGSNVSWGSLPAGVFTHDAVNNRVYRNDPDDDFIFGDDDINFDGTPGVDTETKMFFDKSKGAFRAGAVDGTQWDDGTNVGSHSTAMGESTTAKGYASTAMGSFTTAEGYATAMGLNTTAEGFASTAMGESTTAEGDYSTAMGQGTTAEGYFSTAMGQGTTAEADFSTAMGLNTTAEGYYSTSMGNGATAKGYVSTAMGLNTTASGTYSTAMGRSTTADENNSTAIGMFNDNTVTGELLTVGNGTGPGSESNAFEVYKNGDVVVGNDLTVSNLSGTGNRNIGVDTDGKLIELAGGGAFTSSGGQTTANNLTDDFIVGAATLDYGGSGTETKMFFDDSKGAFRAGAVGGTAWNDGSNVGLYSVAMGYNTTASGLYSTAMGNNSIASGNHSVAIGEFTESSGNHSFSSGYNSKAIGDFSTAMDNSTTASGNYSMAMGYFTTASGESSTAMGYFTTAFGESSTAMGYFTTAGGDFSTAMSVSTIASGLYTTAMGLGTIADESSSVSMGIYNDNTVTGELLTIGNGTSPTNRSNSFEVYQSGDVVVGNDLTVSNLSGVGNRNIGVDANGKLIELAGGGGGGAFTSAGGQTTINNLTDDFIVGDASLDYDGSGNDTKMFFDESKGALRVGAVGGLGGTAWNDGSNVGLYSVAMGYNTTASGGNSTALGVGTTASEDFSTAMGQSTTASGNSSTVMGKSTTASGDYSTAMGSNTTASNEYSTSMGESTTASGAYSTAMGRDTKASGETSTAMGISTTAGGLSSIAMGASTTADGAVSTAMGNSTTASGNSSTTMGVETTAESYAETVIGTYNTDYTPDNTLSFDADDRAFVIGNGISGALSDAMIVYKNGNTDLNGNLKVQDDVTLSNLAGSGTQNLQIDNTGKVITGGGGGGGGLPEVTELEYTGVDILIDDNVNYTDIPNITKSLDANSTYIVKGILGATRLGSSNIDIKFDYSSTTDLNYMTVNNTGFGTNGEAADYNIIGSISKHIIDGIINTTGAGTFKLQIKRSVSSSSNSNITGDTKIILIKVK